MRNKNERLVEMLALLGDRSKVLVVVSRVSTEL